MGSTFSELLGSERSLAEWIILEVESGLHIWHLCLLLWPLSLLNWKVETWSNGFCCFRLEVVGQIIEYFIQLHINLDDLVVLFSSAHLEDIVFAHNVAEEIGVQCIDNVKDELSITLSYWIVREVLLQEIVTLDNFCEIFLACILVCRNINLLDLRFVECFAFALHNLNEKL